MEQANINGYVLKYKLGIGGMAEVWYAENYLQKPAAIKILLKKFYEEEELVARFENEARLMVQLSHPHIRNIYDFGTIDGRPCMVMEYLEGNDLSERMKSGEKFTNDQLTGWWNQLVDALQYTHRKNIIHRDIKPSNLFVTETGTIKVLDFGIAKIKDNITVTQTGSRMGTLMYMSPEQVYDVKNLTHKTDAYSLAVTFYHLVTGTAPYDSSRISDFEIQESIVRKNIDTSILPQPWRTLLPGYFFKNAEDRRELRKIDLVNEGAADETIIMDPQQMQPMQDAPQETSPVYNYAPPRHKSSTPYILLSLALILGLIAFALNKDKVLSFFKEKEKPEATVKLPDKEPKPEPKINNPPPVTDTVVITPDTVTSQGEDGGLDQVIVSVDLKQKENNLKSEIKDYYLTRSDCSSLSRFFADTVRQYYKKSNEPLSSIRRECELYHGKWRFTEADIDDNSYVFTHNQNGKVYVDFSMLYKIKQNTEDDWIPYKIDVAMVMDENNKIERIVERRIEKL